MTADDVIANLGLEPHPEGGYFRETFRDAAADANGRSRSTAIYFLLRAGQASRWHTVDAVEVWHWYAGVPLDLGIAAPHGPAAWTRLGANLSDGERPQAVVPQGHWQMAKCVRNRPALTRWSVARSRPASHSRDLKWRPADGTRRAPE